MIAAIPNRRAPSALSIVVGAALMALWAATARAAEGPIEALGGWEGDSFHQGYGYAGVGWLIPAGPRRVIPVRLSGSYLYYNFRDAGSTTMVESPGVSLLTGIRIAGARGSFTVMGGGEVRRERREKQSAPAITEVSSSGIAQADGDLALGPRWRGFMLVNYSGAAQYVYGRGALRFQFTNLGWQGPTSLFAGIEAVRQGNDETNAAQGGGFFEWNLVRARVSASLHGGYKETWSAGERHRHGSYVGASLYHRF
jgi:hypothetical protein